MLQAIHSVLFFSDMTVVCIGFLVGDISNGPSVMFLDRFSSSFLRRS